MRISAERGPVNWFVDMMFSFHPRQGTSSDGGMSSSSSFDVHFGDREGKCLNATQQALSHYQTGSPFPSQFGRKEKASVHCFTKVV